MSLPKVQVLFLPQVQVLFLPQVRVFFPPAFAPALSVKQSPPRRAQSFYKILSR
jgi:hypothetical protein